MTLALRVQARIDINFDESTVQNLQYYVYALIDSCDKEELEILEAFDLGKLKRFKNTKNELANHQTISEASFKKDARINISLFSKDLRAIQIPALREGMPYQTLVSSFFISFHIFNSCRTILC